MKKKKLILTVLIVIIIVASLLGFILGENLLVGANKVNLFGQVDDWKYSGQSSNESSFSKASGVTSSGGLSPSSLSVDSTQSISSGASFSEETSVSNSDSTIGFSTGGSKDINNFRENIENGYFPISTDITYNGIFYDYYFDTKTNSQSKTSDQIFTPSYSTAVSKDPISNEEEYYMTIGLNSNIKQSDFIRKKLNLVVVLDISGSMSSSFNSYYYDKKDSKNNEKDEDSGKSKMEIANESVNILLDQLNDDDRFGMVLFDNDAYLAKPLNLVSKTDVAAIKNHILDIKAQGGTNFEAGYKEANEVMKEYEKIDSDEYENRIIVITDAMPNVGRSSKDELFTMIDDNAQKGIYTSFIGVGVDFNTEVIEKLSDTKGANYYSVHSSSEFKDRMGEQFEYMVTPLVFDLNLDFSSKDYKIEKVYGSDTANALTGSLMKVNTLFPSKSSETGEVKGGVVLLKLKKLNKNTTGTVKLEVSYKNRNGEEFNNSQEVEYSSKETEKYENTGIRKAIVLTRYVNTIKNWILYERSDDDRFIIDEYDGIIDCDYTEQEVRKLLGQNERKSQKLTVSDEYKEIFKQIKDYIIEENKELKDDTFDKEIDILNKLLKV